MKMEIVYRDGKKETIENVESFIVTEEQTTSGARCTFDIAQIPTEGKLFEVNHLKIDRSVFGKPMSDNRQETTRQIIQEAFIEVDKHPERYVSRFYTLIPEMRWKGYKTVMELKEYANDLGGQMADWVELALEWAQRICNGESWETVCNDADTANWYRLVVWKNGNARLVGGSRCDYNYNPVSNVFFSDYDSIFRIYNTVPLVVFKM